MDEPKGTYGWDKQKYHAALYFYVHIKYSSVINNKIKVVCISVFLQKNKVDIKEKTFICDLESRMKLKCL